MNNESSFYFGNALIDQIRGTGWFIGQFVPAELGLRHQTAVEVKLGMHSDGERRLQPWAQGRATSIAILVRGSLLVEFHVDSPPKLVVLERAGDYVVYGPKVVHSWQAIGDTVVLTVRFPSVQVTNPPNPAAE